LNSFIKEFAPGAFTVKPKFYGGEARLEEAIPPCKE
jgi:hypothetical protein